MQSLNILFSTGLLLSINVIVAQNIILNPPINPIVPSSITTNPSFDPIEYRLVKTYGERWNDDLSDWAPSDSSYYTYTNDVDDLLSEWQYIYFDEDAGLWVPVQRDIHSYDNSDNLILRTTLWWEDDAWVNDRQYLYTYDDNGNRLSDLRQIWDTGEWKNTSQILYDYDANNQLITEAQQGWLDPSFVNVQKYQYEYENGLLVKETYETWKDSIWANHHYKTFEHNVNGDLTLELRYSWNDDFQFFELLNRREVTYDINGFAIYQLSQYWDESLEEWVNSRQVTFEPNEFGDPLDVLQQQWYLNNWVNQYHNTYTYTAEGLIESYTHRKWYLNATEWDQFNRIFYCYESFTDLEEIELDQNEITVFPNPAKDEIILSFHEQPVIATKYELFNLQGEQLLKGDLDSETRKINISDLSAGMYILKVNKNELEGIEKIIVVDNQ